MVKIPCEIMSKNVLPYVRSQIARELVGVYNLSQSETARRMGITQAAVSWYISNKRAIRLPSINGHQINDMNVKKNILSIAEQLAQTQEIQFDMYIESICKICRTLGISREKCMSK